MRRLKLHHWILIAMALGAAIGLPLNIVDPTVTVQTDAGPEVVHLAQQIAGYGDAIGDIFLRLLKMVVVPLIISSLISGVTSMGNVKQLGRLGGLTLAYYMITSMLAITVGIVVVNVIRPGVGSTLSIGETAAGQLPSAVAAEDRSVWQVLWDQLVHMIPTNPVEAAGSGDMLPVIFFSLLLGMFISMSRRDDEIAGKPDAKQGASAGETLKRFFEALFEVMMKMTLFVIHLAPFGVFGFMLYAAAGHGISAFESLAWYALTVFLGLVFHAFITLPLLLWVLAKRSPLQYARDMMPALLTAFSTASSNGTLPLTMSCIEDRAGISNRVSSFVLPLGATINMDGTALYEAVAVLFIAQVGGYDLTVGQQVIVAFTALLASVGAAGIPHAGTVMMVVVLQAVGLPTGAVGMILAVDRILDMLRTTVNVWSDSTAAAVVARRDVAPPALADGGT